MQYQIIHKKPETPIETIISAYEEAVGRHGASEVENTQNATSIQKLFEVPNTGTILARFAQNSAPRFNMSGFGQSSFPVDGFIMYLGFDESSKQYQSMLSDAIQALEGK